MTIIPAAGGKAIHESPPKFFPKYQTAKEFRRGRGTDWVTLPRVHMTSLYVSRMVLAVPVADRGQMGWPS